MTRTQLKIPDTEIKNSKNIFALFTALNAIGYNAENNPVGMSSTRKKVKSAIKQYDFKKQYPTIIYTLKRHHPWYFIHLILATQPTYSSQNFVANIKKFSREPVVENLWKITKNYQIKEVHDVAPFFKREVIQLVKFLNKTPARLKKIVLIINLLDAHWRGYAIKVKSIGYIVVGPGSIKDNGELIRHELLHFMAPFFRIPKNLVVSRLSPSTASYTNYRIKNRECVVRALSLLYQKQILHINISLTIKREEKHFPHIKKILIYLENKIGK